MGRPRPRSAPPAPALVPLLALALAGCLAPGVPEDPQAGADADLMALAPLTEAAFGLGEFLRLRVPSHDGARIHVDVQLPDGAPPYPVLVSYTPYSLLGDEVWALERDLGLEPGTLRGQALVDAYVPRGYAVAVAHVRGTGESEGCLTVGGPDEGKDGHAVVEALAAAPWSNGRVAMMGTSYVGTTPLETAIEQPPHLAAIVPISPVSEWYRYYFERGEQRANGAPPPGSSHTDAAFWAALGLAPGPRTGTSGLAEDAACVAEFAEQYWLQDDYSAWWKARDLLSNVGRIQVPVLFAHGWNDENTATTMIDPFWRNLTSAPEKRAWLQQHGHGVPGSKEAFHSYAHRWLDHWLLGRDNGALLLPPVVVEDNLGGWRTEATWPPEDAAPVTFWLAAGGGLVAEAPVDGGSASYFDDATGSEDPADEGTNHLRFVSDLLEAPLHVAGTPTMRLAAASDQPDTAFAVHLYDRAPDGSEAFLTRGYADPRHRASLERGEDLTPGQRYEVTWPMHPRDHRVEAGHQLVVVVKSTDSYIIADAHRATNTLHFGPDGSWIALPVVDDAARTYLEAPPAPWDEA